MFTRKVKEDKKYRAERTDFKKGYCHEERDTR